MEGWKAPHTDGVKRSKRLRINSQANSLSRLKTTESRDSPLPVDLSFEPELQFKAFGTHQYTKNLINPIRMWKDGRHPSLPFFSLSLRLGESAVP